ncbi:hypothetical protein N7449_008516 [Penicillium cf. viridicatum]|uniref:C2H2-type domain-containing protein n=1 Tax=Penicillium cf. viridicatum TaxID=2972119 RepID=A0A9W9J8A7_9EURO|nr:hypothetical protein N7449_008516 [Penicillium cf. viridicatum]
MDCKKPEDGQPDGQPPQEIRIPCPVCKYRKFRSEQAFCDHLQAEHNIFPCPKCDAIYACRDDLARHKSERHGKVNYKVKHKPKHKGKFSPVIRSVSSPTSENTSSTQLPVQLSPQPARASPSTAHALQPSTKTQTPPAQIRQSSAWVHQGDDQGCPARAQVVRSPHSPVFHPRHQFRQMHHPLPPRPVNASQVPMEIYQEPSQTFQPPGQVPRVSVGFYQASDQVFQPVRVPGSPAGFYQPPAQLYQTPNPPSHTPSPVYQSPPSGYQNQVERYRAASQGHRTPIPIYQTHSRRRKKLQVYRPPLQVPQFPEENYQSLQQFWNSQFLNQEPQHQEPQHQEPQHQEPQHQEPQHQEPQHQEPQHQEPQHQEPQHQEPQHQEPQHQEPQHQEPQHQEPENQKPQQAEQLFRAPARDSHTPEQYSQSPVQDSQQAKEISHFPQQGLLFLRNSQILVQNSQDAEIPQSSEDSKSPEEATQQAEQFSQSFSQSSQPLELNPLLELSQFPMQVPQEAEKVTQSLQKGYQSLGKSQFLVRHYEQAEEISQSTQHSQSAVHISDQTEQGSHSSLHLSAHDPIAAETNEADRATTSTPATNTTTSHLFIPPPPTDPTFSLVYRKMPHRWTDLEPLEQTLIIRYLLATCHSPQRLHSQGYNAPRTIDTKSCLNHDEPHQHHITPRPANSNSTHRKAIVLDCEMIETTVCTSELAFITAIDFLTGEVLINSYVTPTAPVTNWLTPVSGITQEKMDAAIAEGNAFVSNADARGGLRKFLNHETVLIGHALQHDLRTLSLIHGRIVDTSVITSEAVFPNVSSKTTLPRIWGLETLAKELIGIEIRGCLQAWAEKTRDSLAHVRNRRGARRNWGKKGGGANADKGQEQKKTAE